MRRCSIALAVWLAAVLPLYAQEVAPLLAKIKAVGREGKGNVEATKAWQQMVDMGPQALIPVLEAFDDASPTALNWLRSAVDAIAERGLTARAGLPAAELERFVLDKKRHPRARRAAFEWLTRADPAVKDKMLPRFLDDPGQELRREAVDTLLLKPGLALLDQGKNDEGGVLLQKAIDKARDRDQLLLISGRLGKLGIEINLTERFGFITRWMLAGPFDNRKGIGFAAEYPPDKGVDLKAVYKGQDEKEVRWEPHQTELSMGLVDISKIKGNLKGAVVYAYTEVESPAERPVELRAASNNAIRMYLNGKEIFFREEYHHGMEMDQHVGKSILKAGRNEILLKVCQNEQTEPWAQRWSFQLRVCDDLGARVPLTVVAARP